MRIPEWLDAAMTARGYMLLPCNWADALWSNNDGVNVEAMMLPGDFARIFVAIPEMEMENDDVVPYYHFIAENAKYLDRLLDFIEPLAGDEAPVIGPIESRTKK